MDRFAVETSDDLREERVVLSANQLVVRVLETRDEDELLPAAVLLAEIAQHRAQDAVDPRSREGIVTQVRETEPGSNERFLDGIFGVGHRVRAADREGEEPVEVWDDERFEPRAQVERGVEACGVHSGPGWRASRDVAGVASIVAYGATTAIRGGAGSYDRVDAPTE